MESFTHNQVVASQPSANEQTGNFGSICRLCANHNDKLVGIFSEEGISNELLTKINMYLPVKVARDDDLPQQCCWGCASTVLAWHELVLSSAETERRLKSYQIFNNKQTGNLLGNNSEKLELSSDVSYAINQSDRLENGNPDLKSTKSENEWKKLQKFEEDDFCSDNNDFLDVKLNSYEDSSVKNEQQTKTITLPDKLYEDEWLSKDCLEKLESDNFACEYCSTVCNLEEEIVNHVKLMHSDKTEILDDFKSAENVQQNTKKERRKPTKIDQETVNAAKVIVEGRVYYNCKTCGKSLHSPYTYIWHMRIHTGERPFVCDLCGKQFRVSQGLVRHLKETHEGIKNFPCDLCGRMFTTKRNVVEHRRIHTNERPYICDLCGKTFKQKASLFVHNRSHTDSFPFQCSYCERGFRTKPPLLIHITKHTGEKPYPCDVCGRCFRIKYELKRHRIIHSDEKPFVCNECGLSFRQKRYLRNHTKVNHNRATL